MDEGLKVLRSLVVTNSPSACYTCTPEFIEYELSRGNKIELFSFNDCSYALVKIEKYSQQEFGWLFNNRFYDLKIESARLLGSQALSMISPNSSLVELTMEIFDKTTASVVVLPAIRKNNFNYKIDDFSEKSLFYFLLGGWQDCITLPVPYSLEIYLSKLGKKKRYNLNRQSKMIREVMGAELSVREFSVEEDVPEFLQKMMFLNSEFVEKNSWIKTGYMDLARVGLFHGFVFGTHDEPVAVVDAKKTNDTLCITKILINSRLKEMSPGATAIYEIMKFIISGRLFRFIDFGYGEPGQKMSSVTGIDQRGRVVIVKKNTWVCFLFFVVNKLMSIRIFLKQLLRRYGR